MNDLKGVEAYTDGSCLGTSGFGGWGFVALKEGGEVLRSGSRESTTNNKMELTAVLELLKFFKEATFLVIHTDSQYVKNGITVWIHNWKRNGWKTANRKPVKNKDLWQLLELEASRHSIEWKWVKAHNGNKYNEIADDLARNAAESLKE